MNCSTNYHIKNWLLPSLNNFYVDAVNDYTSIKKRILSGEFERLAKDDQENIMDFFVRMKVIETAIKKEDSEVIKILVANGLKFENNHFFSTHIHPELVIWLLENNVKLSDYDLKKITKECFSKVIYEQVKGYYWDELLIDCLKKCTFNVFTIFDCREANHLIKLAKRWSELEEILFKHFVEWEDNEEKEALIKKHIVFFVKKRLWKIKIEDLLDKEILPHIFSLNEQDNQIISQYLPSSEIFEQINVFSGNFKSALICFNLLQCQRLADIMKVLKILPSLTNSQEPFSFIIEKRLQERCKHFIQALQIDSSHTIWEIISIDLSQKDFYVIMKILKELGCNPNWINSRNQNILFTNLLRYKFSPCLFAAPFNYAQKNRSGLNALEFHCSKIIESISHFASILQVQIHLASIKFLVKEGLKPALTFSRFLDAKQLIPEEGIYFQILLMFFLQFSNITTIKKYFDQILDRESRRHLEMILQKLGLENKEDPTPLCLKLNRSMIPVAQIISKEIFSLPNYLNHIPESSIASQLIYKLLNQRSEKTRKLVPIECLFEYFLHDDLIYFIQYLFKQPETMSKFIKDYMHVSSVNIYPYGNTQSTFGKMAHTLLEHMKDFTHFPKQASQLDASSRTLIEAFKKSVPPIPLQTLEIQEKSSLNLLNRTVVLNQCEGYKFLQKKEDYAHFSQELSVTEVFRKMEFESRFHQPIGIYALKKLPKAFKIYKKNLPPKPFYVYHYQAEAGIFNYPRDLSISEYKLLVREKWIKDAVRMNKIGIVPDFAALFHNEEQNRIYILLIDLLISMNYFSALGGAGRLDQAFAKIRYPNIRATGLTDMRDAKVYYLNHREIICKEMHGFIKASQKIQYFFSLYGLSNIFLVDMLILVDLYKKQGLLDHKNKKFLTAFAKDLCEGYVKVCSNYSGKPIEEWEKFALSCGINWRLMALQIAFWTDNSASGYPTYVANETIPNSIYPEDVKVRISVDKAANFDPLNGFISEGEQDIGMFNGPLALTEFEKSIYSAIFAIILAEPLNNYS